VRHISLLRGLAVVLVVAATPAAATASIGTGVGATPLTLTTPAKSGQTYTFRWLYVKNTGSSPSSYTVYAQRLSPGSARSIPASWIRLSPTGFRLAPGAIRRVTVTLAVPRSATGASYMTNLVASTTAPHAPGATALGAAAADTIAFRIPSTSSFPWLVVVIAGAIGALVALIYTLRRSRVTLRLDLGRRSRPEPGT
jgi:hypothetical protein